MSVTYNPSPWKLTIATSTEYATAAEADAALHVAAAGQTPGTLVTYIIEQTTTALKVEDVPVPVDCVMGEFGDPVYGPWSECVNGSRQRTATRTRSVVTPPANGGAACPSEVEVSTDVEACVLPPVDCVISEWSAWTGGAWSVCANSTQSRTETRTRTVVTPPSNGGAVCGALSETRVATQACVMPPAPTGAVFYGPTSVPPGVTNVTRFTYDGAQVIKSVVSVAESGLPARVGRFRTATPATLASVWASVQPGDYIELGAGTYTAKWGEGDWFFGQGETYKKGTAAQPIDMVAAPGATVIMKPSSRPAIILGNGDRATEYAEYLNFSGFAIVGQESCISGGGHTTNPSGGPDETGGRHIRIVGMDLSITDRTANTMTGLLDLQSDDWKVLGNTFTDPSNRTVINNNHGCYIQGGADDVEVAFNVFKLHVGHVIQNHQDGTPKLYQNLHIHDNLIAGTNYGDMRGISVINVADASTVKIARNVIRKQGQGGWGGINIYRGQVQVIDNEITDSQGGLNLNGQYGGSRTVTASGNKVCPVSGYPRTAFENGATASQLTETNIKACS